MPRLDLLGRQLEEGNNCVVGCLDNWRRPGLWFLGQYRTHYGQGEQEDQQLLHLFLLFPEFGVDG